jgi:hypothetical protein
LASAGQQNLTQAGQAQGQLASTNQALGLADINALATLGGQQQTIAQNKELFPLSNLSTLSGLLRGYTTPTTVKTTAEQSPLSGMLGIGAGAAGLFQVPGTAGTGKSLYDQIINRNNATNEQIATNPYFTPGIVPPAIEYGEDNGNPAVDTATGGYDYFSNI